VLCAETSAEGKGVKPGPVEYKYHNAMGRALTIYDSLAGRPLDFSGGLYRLLKNWQ
jgi:hypothetical protein